MTLDLTALQKALNALAAAIESSQRVELAPDFDKKLWETVRGGVIKSFEVSFELSWKMMQRWIEMYQDSQDQISRMTKQDLFRKAAQYNLISDPSHWFIYLKLRNLTSHTYDEIPAQEVYEAAMKFLKDGQELLLQLGKENA